MQKSLLSIIAIIVFVFVFPGRKVDAVPAFSRRFAVSCSACHTTPPRLNETGYRFRAAGFRWPEAIGIKESSERLDILDYMSARIQVRFRAKSSKIGSTKTSNVEGLKLQALELYPFIGSWGKYFSTNTKVTFAPGTAPTVENAYLRATIGNQNRFFSVRAGIFHPFDGYGAADSPATISRPFFQTTPSNRDGSTFFTTWGFDQPGAEVGLDYGRTSVRAALLKGLVLRKEDGQFKASALRGVGLTPRTGNSPDFQLFVNHMFSAEGGGVSLHYYHGNLSLPVTGSETFFLNKFDRVALYGSYPVLKRLQLMGGVQGGRDHLATGKTFVSEGAFVEATVPVNKLSAVGIRYDWFDPARGKVNNELRGITAYVNAWFYNQIRVVAEYQHKRTLRGLAPEQRDDTFQVRFIYFK